MKDKKTFGMFIKEKRMIKNYSQKDLAELLYVTESAVSKWERGITYPDITLITDICRVLEISEKELIQSSDDDEYRKIKKNSDKFNKIKKSLWLTLNIIYLAALIICFIVNLAVEHKLSWFFIVLASILVGYSFCPTYTWIANRFKKVIFIGSTFISLFFLFLTCSIYTSNYWFMIPTMGVLLGYYIIFYPILFNSQKHFLTIEKYQSLAKWFLISYMLGILILIILLLVFINLYNSFNLWLGLVITICCFIIPLIFGAINLFCPSKHIFRWLVITYISILGLLFSLGTISAENLKNTSFIMTYQIEEEYKEIKIDIDSYDVNFYLSQNNENKIIYKENKKINLYIEVSNNVIQINQIDNRKFYEKWIDFTDLKLDIYLSKEVLETVNIDSKTGDILIKEDFIINNLDITNSTGNVDIKKCIIKNSKVKTSNGNIAIENSVIEETLVMEVSTGNINLLNTKSNSLDIIAKTGDIKLTNTIIQKDFNMKGSTGDVIFEGFDATNIYITLSTGDVKGTILTSKFFIVNSSTGDVNVPKTRDGGECQITISTGDVDISYK